jgi:hypothetical protein
MAGLQPNLAMGEVVAHVGLQLDLAVGQVMTHVGSRPDLRGSIGSGHDMPWSPLVPPSVGLFFYQLFLKKNN